MRDAVPLDGKDVQAACCELRCDCASHTPETDDNDVVYMGHFATG